MLLDFIYSIIYGIIQGITEWLPISSTGHLILAENFIPLEAAKGNNFFEMFEVVIQFGSILAVLIIFWNKLWPLKYEKKIGIKAKPETFKLWSKVIVGIIPALIAGVVIKVTDFDKIMDSNWVIATTLIVYGVLFIIVEAYNKNRKTKINELENITYKMALMVGCFQALALIPGTSRSGATILGAIILGFYRPVAAEFSFFMAIPTMAGASALSILDFILEDGKFTSEQVIVLITGTVVSFLVSVFAIKFLMSFIQKRDFSAFGYYRIALGIIVLILCFTNVLKLA